MSDKNRGEISSLNDDSEIDDYWGQLYRLDQNVLMGKSYQNFKFDSISISNMIRAALIVEEHGEESIKPNTIIPVFSLAHNYNGDANVAYWPIIKIAATKGGVIKSVGYPSYPLECIATTFYDFSLLNQDSRFSELVHKLDVYPRTTVVSDLDDAFKNLNKLQELQEKSVIGSWYIQPFKDEKTSEIFDFVKMSDNALYKRRKNRLLKLEKLDSTKKLNVYKIENEPFDWYYQLADDSTLSLFDQNSNELIKYTSITK